MSPDLSGEMVLGSTWLHKHNVICEIRAGCIYLGDGHHQRLYLVPEVQRTPPEITSPELCHNFPDEFINAFCELKKRHALRFHQGGRLRQTTAVQHEIRLSDPTPQCLPRIYDILKDIGNAKIFSSLDLKSGYWRIPLAPGSRKYTAFSTPSGGQYQFRVMPFGPKNAPSTFQNLMRHVLAEQWGRFVIAYLNGIIVYLQTWEEHLLHLSLVLERLEIYGMTCSPTKCSFGQTSLPYLGHIINETGNSSQPKHLDAILNAEQPRTRKALRSLIGTRN